MFVKHYISILIVAISILGIVSQRQIDLPNQEIVVQFDNSDITTEEVDGIINSIKIQLQELGVEEINVSDDNLGELKITYYTNADVSSIKNKLSKNGSIKVDLNEKSPKNKNKTHSNNNLSYNLDVYEIQESNTDWGFNGINVLNIDYKSDQLFNPNSQLSTYSVIINNDNSVTRETYKVLRSIAFSITEIPHKIPEVRAGPIC